MTLRLCGLLGSGSLILAAMLGCGDAPGTNGTNGDESQPTQVLEIPKARTLPLPMAGREGSRPVPGPSGSGRLVWDVPDNWVQETPSSGMRLVQYRVAGPAGEATCAVFYFGPGQGGDPMSNAARWAGQFSQPDGTPSQARMKVQQVEGTSVEVQMVEVRGTYNGGMTNTDTPAQPMPGSMLLGGIAAGPDAPWFFKLTGPEATVESQRPAMERLLRSLRPEN